ncbi:hypothetical protein ACSBR1_006348 [Camellia fascicularis]
MPSMYMFLFSQCFPSLVELRKAKGEEKRLAAVDKLVAMLVLLEEYFINCSSTKGNGNFFGGDGIGYVDIALGCFLGWFKASEKLFDVMVLDIAKTPRLVEWAERFFCSDDAVKNVIPETEKLMEFAKRNLMK